MGPGSEAKPERLPRSGSTLWPALGYVTAAVFAWVALSDGFEPLDLTVLAACALLGGVVFAVLQRPAATVDPETLHLRGMVSTTHIPLAAVERVSVGRVLAVFAGERRYVSPSVQRSMRSVMGRTPRDRKQPADRPVVSEADLVEERLRRLAEEARARAGVGLLSDDQRALADGALRTWSGPVIALIAVPAAVLVVLLVVLA